ncbi:thioredoxin-disulfide reductase [Candidatus Saccharibacteria bacterium]|nr:thioredoxin-disulfide reductase [Candidatus Saccharibacteria bacterium]MBR0415694.1 thioredoxin-disulfide reductase [Candidatus Saccharibacteria bacterium]
MEEYDIVIIGGGPAGLTAGIYAARAGKKVLVLEGRALGGQIVNAPDVRNYPGTPSISGVDLSMNMYKQVLEHGGEVKFERAMGIKDKIVHTDGGEYKAKAIILATGAENRKLGLYGEDKLVGKGVSYCATCDGNFYKDKTVAVVGGGNTALEDAIYLADICKKVCLIHRREEFRGDKTTVDKIKALKNVEMILSANVKEILGEEKVEGLELEIKDGERKEIKVDGVFFAIGYEPQANEFADSVELDEQGYIKTKDGVHTSTEGIYVAGDARAKDLKQLVTAASDGAIAATVAVKEME